MSEFERERAIHALRESYARGDLTSEQLQEELDAVFAAESSSDVAKLVPAQPASSAGRLPSTTVNAVEVETIARHLEPGERVEWVGRPDPSKHLTQADAYLIPFSIVWCGFAVFWETTAIRGGGGLFTAFGLVFVALGLYNAFGRFIYKKYRKRHTIYAVTNRRVIAIVRGSSGESVEATYLRSIPNISSSNESDSRGSVDFGVSPLVSRYANTGMELLARGQRPGGVAFYDIPDPRGVADLVARLSKSETGLSESTDEADRRHTPLGQGP